MSLLHHDPDGSRLLWAHTLREPAPDAPPRGGRPHKHGKEFRFAGTETWAGPDAATTKVTDRYGTAKTRPGTASVPGSPTAPCGPASMGEICRARPPGPPPLGSAESFGTCRYGCRSEPCRTWCNENKVTAGRVRQEAASPAHGLL